MELKVDLKERSYHIKIERDSLKKLNQYLDLNRKTIIITDEGVPEKYSQTVASQCKEPIIYTVKQGEQSKSIEIWSNILTEMIDNNFTRKDLVIAVGGGVVGDLAGFVASTYMRGIEFVNIPTTTLSQIDSSIGGKTGINHNHNKNIIGSFYQPSFVLIDPDTLDTLDQRNYTSGLVEAVKSSLLRDEKLFNIFEQENYKEKIEEILYRSLTVKKYFVENDEKEGNIRMALNLGHTLGHSIESAVSLYTDRTYYHGECVGVGLIPMIEDENLKHRVKKVLEKIGAVTKIEFDYDLAAKALYHDKKSQKDTIKVVKLEKIGQYRLENIKTDKIEEMLKEIM